MDILDDIRPANRGSCLMVRIDNNGTIKKCNEPFIQFTGKNNEETINTPFSTFLSKNSDIVDSWMDFLLKMKDDEIVPEMELPLQTSQGEDVIISWTNFPLKIPEDDAPSMLNLIGTPVASAAASKKKSSSNKTEKAKKTSEQLQEQKAPTKKKESKLEPIPTKPKKEEKKVKKQQETNTIKEKKEPSKKSKKPEKNTKTKKLENQDQAENGDLLNIEKQYDNHQQENKRLIENKSKPFLQNIRNRITPDSPGKHTDKGKNKVLHRITPESIRGTNTTSLLQRAISKRKTTQSLGKIEDKTLTEQIKILQRQNKELDNEIKKLEKKIETLEIGRKTVKTFINKNISFIRDCVSIDRKRAEFSDMMNQMAQRKQKLEHLETDMIFEKKEFKKKIEEFFTWREKLEQLEQEIEKRRQYLEEHETFLNENFDKVLEHELNSPATYATDYPQINELDEEEETAGIVEEDDLFESLTVEAVILQRGRIKKVNSLFQQLIGFTEKDLVGKHLVDFVGPSGLAGVEQHYVNRLKGVDDISYDTVFLTEKEKEIPVHVKVKTGEFQGQRAEIATFREL